MNNNGKKLSFNYTRAARAEVISYKLNENDAYLSAVTKYLAECDSRFCRYGSLGRDTCTRNMLKALRMLPALNSPDDWARLHVTEGVKVKP